MADTTVNHPEILHASVRNKKGNPAMKQPRSRALGKAELEELFALSEAQQTLVKTTAIENLQIHRHNNLKWLYLHAPNNSAILSILDLDAPSTPVATYQHAMLIGAHATNVKSVCNLGMAIGSLERHISHTQPNMSIDSVEIMSTLVAIAQIEFQLPPSVNVHTMRAEDFLADNDAIFDLILCDIFDGGRPADCLKSISFFKRINKALSREGNLFLHLLPEDEQDAIEVLSPLRDVFAHQWLIDIPHCKNVVVVAGQRRLSPDVLAETINRARQNGLTCDFVLDAATELP